MGAEGQQRMAEGQWRDGQEATAGVQWARDKSHGRGAMGKEESEARGEGRGTPYLTIYGTYNKKYYRRTELLNKALNYTLDSARRAKGFMPNWMASSASICLPKI